VVSKKAWPVASEILLTSPRTRVIVSFCMPLIPIVWYRGSSSVVLRVPLAFRHAVPLPNHPDPRLSCPISSATNAVSHPLSGDAIVLRYLGT
jgi:hypothetical protein